MPKNFDELGNKMTPEQLERSDAKAQILLQIQKILARPYRREFRQDDDGSWFARIVEFPGCMTVGATREEADQMLDDAAVNWLTVMLEDRDPDSGTDRGPVTTPSAREQGCSSPASAFA
ncbi:MAG TPA: type II toxin-antitoxin system HicB family antitoxin [Candidatus Baltobacteraceae bacterium]|jgi:predicted RNase H-like HicB family nuclease